MFFEHGLAFDLAGNLYVATAGSGFFPFPVRILRFTPGGVSSVFAEENFSGFLTTFPTGLAFDNAGNLYAAMSVGGEAFIQKYTPGGQGSRFANSFYSPVGPPNYPPTRLGGIAFDSAGFLYAANPASNAIEKFTPGGVSSVFADTADGLSSPSFVAIRNDNVPEPSAWAMLGLGLPALLGAARLRRREAYRANPNDNTMNTLPLTALIAASLLTFTGNALGQSPPKYGVRTSVSISDVLSSGSENNPSFDFDGGPGTFLTASGVNDLRGTADSLAGLNFTSNQPPILRSRSVLSGAHTLLPGVVGAHATTLAFASGLFQYIGPTPGTLHLAFSLDGLVSDLPADLLTYIVAQVAVFNLANYQFSSDYGTLVSEFHAVPKASDLTTLQILDDTGGAMASRTTTLSFSVTPGETFYVWERLDTSALRDARYADAFNTMTAAFDHPELVVAVNNVPEPGSLPLLVCGVAALARWWHPRRGAGCGGA